MKILSFFLVCLISGLTARSQQAYFELKAGTSFPVFAYSSNNLKKGCFTQTGLGVSAEADLRLWQHWGLQLQSGLQLHSVDVGLLGWEKMKNDVFLQDLYIRSDPYRIIHLVGGPAYHQAFFKKFNLDISLLGGVFFSRSPYQLYKPVYFMSGPPFYEITPSRDIGFAWGGDCGLSYAITDCYDIGLSATFLQSDVDFRFRTANGIRVDERMISFLNVSLGLVLHLF